MNKNIKVIIFDLGNVIIDIDMNATINEFEKLGVKGIERYVTQSHSIGGVFTQLEQGKVSQEEFCNELREMSKVRMTDDQIVHAWNAMLGEIPRERVELIERLKSKYKVVLLSNTNKIHFDAFDGLISQYGYNSLSDLFDYTWYSQDMHISKPSAEIYRQVLSYHNVKAEETVFFDDSQANIDAAKQLGINTYLVEKSNKGIMQYAVMLESWLD